MENARRTLSEVITAIQPREEYSLYRDFHLNTIIIFLFSSLSFPERRENSLRERKERIARQTILWILILYK